MIGSSASTLVEYDRAEHWLARGHRVRRPHRAVEPPALHGQPPRPRRVVPGPVGRGRPRWRSSALADGEGGITTRITALHVAGFVALGRGHLDAADRDCWRRRVRPATRWASCSASPPPSGGWPSARLLDGDHAAAVELTEAGYAASHEVADARQPVPVPGHRHPGPAGRGGPGRRPGVGRPGVRRPARPRHPRHAPRRRPRRRPAAAGRRPHRQGARRCSARPTPRWTARGRWWEAPVVRPRPGPVRARVEPPHRGAALVEEVRAAAAARGAPAAARRVRELGSRLDEHDAAQPWSPLTLRELEVARLVAQGLTNREIAEELRITARTAGLPPGAHPRQARREPPLRDRGLGDLPGPGGLTSGRPSAGPVHRRAGVTRVRARLADRACRRGGG